MADLEQWTCDHSRRENVVTYGGAVIAIRCKSCTKIICPIGNCPGCKKKSVPLHHTVGQQAYCTRDCYQATMAEKRRTERKERDELFKG
jgi:hypothetical protein